MHMPKITLVFSLALIAIGAIFYLITKAGTAMIPGIFGVLLLVCALIAFKGEDIRKHAMHGAALIATLGVLLGIFGMYMAISRMEGGFSTWIGSLGSLAQVLMVVTLGAYVALCVKSFRDARRNRGY